MALDRYQRLGYVALNGAALSFASEGAIERLGAGSGIGGVIGRSEPWT